jgi:hypothetical protein
MKKCKSAQCCDNAYSARNGVLFGMAVAPLHQVHHALTQQIPKNILAHVLGEWAAFAIGGAALFTAASAICNLFSRSK